MTHRIDIYNEINAISGKPPLSLEKVEQLQRAGYQIKWDQYLGYSFAWVEFQTAEDAIHFKLTHL